MYNQANTVIRVTKETRERLADIGSKKDTYDSIIVRMLETRKEVC